MIGIYKITNLINKKSYIGQSVNIQQRWKAHRCKYQTEDSALYRAIRKYGLNNFTFEVLEECQKEQLDEREIFWIKYYGTHNKEKGYNMTDGGDSQTTSKLTKEQVNKIKQLLQTTVLSQQEIADKFNVSQRTISGINSGQNWLEEGITYPIRKNGSVNHFKKEPFKEKYTQKELNEYDKQQCFCKDCGKPIKDSVSGLCNICVRKLSRIVKDRPSREELKQMIRTMPFTKIGELFNVSDNAIRKWCDTYNLPRKKQEINSYSDNEWGKI